MKLKANSWEEDKNHLIFNNVLTLSSDLLQSNIHKGCHYKLRSVIGQEDEFKVTKWTWFNIKVCDTFVCSWMISRKLIDHTKIERAISHILDMVYAPSVSMRDSVGSATSFFHTSMVVHPGSGDHLRICCCRTKIAHSPK